MAGEYDEKFEELTGLIKRTMGGVDEMRLEMRDMRSDMRDMRVDYSSRFDSVDSRFDRVEAKLDLVSGRQNDVIPKVIEMQKTVNSSVEIQNAQIVKIAECSTGWMRSRNPWSQLMIVNRSSNRKLKM